MANCEEIDFDLSTALPNALVPLVPRGREFTDLYINDMPLGAPIELFVGLNASAGFKSLVTGDSFDCLDRATCQGEIDGIGLRVSAPTVGRFRLLVTYGGGGAAARA